jgi:hypothetical protein
MTAVEVEAYDLQPGDVVVSVDAYSQPGVWITVDRKGTQ